MRREIGRIHPLSYVMGVDLGQAQDPTAVIVIESELNVRVWRDEHGDLGEEIAGIEHRVRHAERLPLGMAYPEQVALVHGMLMAAELRNHETELAIDMTGVGRPVFEMFEGAGLKPIGVQITGGLEETRAGTREHRVPKILLVSRLQAALHAGELKFAVGLAEEHALRRELSEFRMRHTDTGRLTFGAREGKHDDLVLALAIGLWRAQGKVRGPRLSRSRLLGV